MATTWLILNGKSSADEALRAAVSEQRDAGHDVQVRVTWEGGDAGRLVDEAVAAGVDRVVAAGGDGTLNEVISALASQDGDADQLPSLGLVPMGTANDFANGAKLPLASGEALAFALSSEPVAMDVIRVAAGDESRWCGNVATGGFGTQVTTQTDPELKKRLGGLAYVLTGISQAGQATPQHARFVGPDVDVAGEFIAIGVGNGKQAGGGQVLCPDAVVDDGLLNLTIVPVASDGAEFFDALKRAFSAGSHERLAAVSHLFTAPWIEISSDEPFTLNLDGEPMHASAFRLEVVPGRVRMHLPPDSPFLTHPS